MTAQLKAILTALGVALGAFAGGWALARSQGATVAQLAADSTARVDLTRDSARVVLQLQAASNDSAAKAAAARAESMAGIAKSSISQILRLDSAARSAQRGLDSARVAADSLRLYRDSVVPSLETEIGALVREKAAADSAGDSWQQAFQRQAAVAGALRAAGVQDSTLIASQRAALAKAAAVSPAVVSPLTKAEGALESAAIGAATVAACKQGVLTIACLAGTAVVVKRIL